MQIETAATLPHEAKLHRQNRSYKRLLRAVAEAQGLWVAVNLDDITGDTPMHKGYSVMNAARYRQMTVETAVAGDKLYIRQVEQAVSNG